MPGAWPYSGWPAVLEPSWRKRFSSSMRHAGIAGQVQQRVEQHRAVPGRQHEAVAVRPVGRGGIELQELREQHGRHVGHAHRHAGMAGLGLLDRVHGQRPDGVGHVLVHRGTVCAHLHRRICHACPAVWLCASCTGTISRRRPRRPPATAQSSQTRSCTEHARNRACTGSHSVGVLPECAGGWRPVMLNARVNASRLCRGGWKCEGTWQIWSRGRALRLRKRTSFGRRLVLGLRLSARLLLRRLLWLRRAGYYGYGAGDYG